MSVEQIISAVTINPTVAIGKINKDLDQISQIRCGEADLDLTVLKLENCNEYANDCAGNSKMLQQLFVPKYVVRKGQLKAIK